MASSAPKCKSFVFTINNYTKKCVDMVKAVPAVRIIAGFEVGKSGTKHIQGAVVFKHAHTYKSASAALGGRASVAKMMGKWEAQDYCFKDGEIVRMEDNSRQGERTDLLEFMKKIETTDELSLMYMLPEMCAKYPRFESRFRFLINKKRSKKFRQIKVHVRWGAAGTGKTRSVMEMDDVFKFNDYEKGAGWWDGYENEKILLIDEFYGGIQYSKFLEILDGYQVRLKIKGSHAYGAWDTVYITSNKPPEEWYKHGMTPALARRITSVTELHLPPKPAEVDTEGEDTEEDVKINKKKSDRNVLASSDDQSDSDSGIDWWQEDGYPM